LTRIYLKSVAIFLSVFVMLAWGAHALGGMQTPDPALRAFIDGCHDKPRPCWFGVVPGITTEQEARDLLAFAGSARLSQLLSGDGFSMTFRFPEPSPYCSANFFIRDLTVFRAELSICRQPVIRVGDLAVLLDGGQKLMSLPPDEMILGGVSLNVEGWPKPYAQVTYITLLSAESDFPRYPWFGYNVSQARYCQLVTNFPRCRVLRR
jgi:hypothetical protein